MSTLSFKGLNKVYPNKVQAVFDFNLEIQDKEFIVFVGPSGCGKSTTLRMVAGLEQISSGELYIDNELVNDVAPKDRNIAMVFQNYALYPHMTVYKNMSFGIKINKFEMPVYEPDSEEIKAIRAENKEIETELAKINRHFKKKQDKLDLLPRRAELYEQLFANFDKIESLRKPVVGKDVYHLKKYKKTAQELEKDVIYINHVLQTKKGLSQETIDSLNAGLVQRQREIDSFKSKIDYLEHNDVPLRLPRKLTNEEIDIEINKTAYVIDLARYLYRKPSELSGGQRQRVALGRTIVRKPKVFLMDEPLSNLDAKLRVQTRGEITKIHKKIGATTIYVTHDQTEAMTMADRIVIMKDGWIQQIGTPKEVFADPANKFVAGFIGSPSMNFLEVEYHEGKISVCDIEGNDTASLLAGNNKEEVIDIPLSEKFVTMLKDYEGKRVIMGVRPEYTYIHGDQNNTSPSEAIPAIADAVELLGKDIIVYTYVNGQKIAFKSDASHNVVAGQSLEFAFDMNYVYFFDKEDGKRIR